jgi:hypothetical protein
LQDNFDSENSENGGVRVLNYDNFANWNVRDGSVDLIAENQFLSGDGLLVDLDGSTEDAGVLESKATFTFKRGDTVNLSFKLAGDQRNFGSPTNSAIVSLGSLFNETFTLLPFEPLTTYTRSFSVTEAISANLSFEGTGGDNVGLLLDDVELSVTPAAVPDPSTILGVLTVSAFGIVSKKISAASKPI